MDTTESERLEVLEDLKMFMKLNEDDFDRGKGMHLLQRFIEKQLNKANDSDNGKASGVRVNALVNGTPAWKDVGKGTPNIDVGCSEEIFIVPKGHKKAKSVICINTGNGYEFHDSRGAVYDLEQVETYMETPQTPERDGRNQ